ncbi:MAG: hypothetical protein J1F64_06400 [Oscillospiraceae bacterium]|nr:hypothetical protein [Oscillospiraceae bacterium]
MRKRYTLRYIAASALIASFTVSGCSSANDAEKERLKKQNAELKTQYSELSENTDSAAVSNDAAISISGINNSFTINGSPAKVECYNIDGKIYVKLSDVGKYTGFTPSFESDSVIRIGQGESVKETYSYYDECDNIPRFESVSPGARKTGSLDLKDLPANTLAAFTYTASEEDINNYINVLLDNDFEFMGEIGITFGDHDVMCSLYQAPSKYSIGISKINGDGNAVITLFDLHVAVDPTAEESPAPDGSPAPEASSGPDQTQSPDTEQS